MREPVVGGSIGAQLLENNIGSVDFRGVIQAPKLEPRANFRKIPKPFWSWSTLKTAAPLAIAAVRYLGAIAGPSWSQKAMRGALVVAAGDWAAASAVACGAA